MECDSLKLVRVRSSILKSGGKVIDFTTYPLFYEDNYGLKITQLKSDQPNACCGTDSSLGMFARQLLYNV